MTTLIVLLFVLPLPGLVLALALARIADKPDPKPPESLV